MKKLVVKIGSSVLTLKNGNPDHARFSALASDIASVINKGYAVAIVSSGAIAFGRSIVGKKLPVSGIPNKQVLSSIGQPLLINAYMTNLKPFNKVVAQILLTHDDFIDRQRYLNARRSMELTLNKGFIPVVNENDAISVNEIKVGDNDTLSAMVAVMLNADRLIILSNISAIYDKDPNRYKDAKPVREITTIKPCRTYGNSRSRYGVGGIKTKITAAKQLAKLGISTTIADGRINNIITKLLSGEKLGTTIVTNNKKVSARKKWVSLLLKSSGSIIIDDGAISAVIKDKSLLAVGIIGISGAFKEGDVVGIMDTNGREIGRGITNYSVTEIERIKGKRSSQINSSLGCFKGDEVIHRDNFVISINTLISSS